MTINRWSELGFNLSITAVLIFFLIVRPYHFIMLYLIIGCVHSICSLRRGASFWLRLLMVPSWLFLIWLYVIGLFRGWFDG